MGQESWHKVGDTEMRETKANTSEREDMWAVLYKVANYVEWTERAMSEDGEGWSARLPRVWPGRGAGGEGSPGAGPQNMGNI